MSKYNLKAIRQRAEKGGNKQNGPANQQTSQLVQRQTSKPANQQTSKPVEKEKVNLTVKVPKSHRAYWVAQSRLQGTNLTKAINQALAEIFGVPENQ